MTEPQNEKQNADVQNDSNTPLEELRPVDVQEVDEDGPEPPQEWGQEGQGGDAESEGDAGNGD